MAFLHSTTSTACNDKMPDATQNEHEQEPLRIMLLGKCGAGKSSSGNTILNKMVFKSEMKLGSVTVHCEKEFGKVDDMFVAVIDTPGLFEKGSNKEDVVRETLQSVKLYEPGPHVFVCVIPLGRLTQEDQDTNTLIEAKFGPRVWDYTIVLFTHGDRLEENKTINSIITDSDENLRNFIRKCSGGFHVFNNKDPGDQKQVSGFMEKIKTLVALNGGSYYKTELYPEKERKIRKRQEGILAEKNKEIMKKEENLKDHYKDEELKKMIENMWRKEEKNARKAAEKELHNSSCLFKSLSVILFLLLFCLLICWSLGVSAQWLLGVAVILILMSSVIFPPIPRKIPWLFKKNE